MIDRHRISLEGFKFVELHFRYFRHQLLSTVCSLFKQLLLSFCDYVLVNGRWQVSLEVDEVRVC